MSSDMVEQLQFLRPEWFYAFIPLLLFVLLMLRRRHSSTGWKAVCDEKLLPFILTKPGGKSSRLPLLLSFIAVALAIIAAAGPVFEKLPQPVFREQSALVILLDLSRSMDATDLKPSRLQRARLKLLDILRARKEGQTALVVYAADAFVVTPLTDDSNTITSMVPALETSLMPGQGSHAYRAIEKALELLQQAGVSGGDVLLMTDGISDDDIEAIETLKAGGHRLSILGIGTTDGGPVPVNGGFLQDASGAIVIPRLQTATLQRAALSGGGLYVSMRADDADIERLASLFTASKHSTARDKQKLGNTDIRADVWNEEGPWLLLLVIPLAALGFRKGWLLCLQVLLLPVLLLPAAKPSYAFELDHLWNTPDQKAMSAFDRGDAAGAAELFENEDWKASAYYRAGKYQDALGAMNNPASSDDYYNRGNALAKLGRYPEAIQAYDEALKLNKANEDAAYNRERVEQAMQQQQNSSQQESEQQNDETSEQNNKDASDGEQNSAEQQQQSQQNQASSVQPAREQSAQDRSAEQQSAQSPQSDSPDADDNPPDKTEIEQAMKDASDAEQQREKQAEQDTENEQPPMAMSDSISEQDQATEQWLKRIPDDPGLLLRRKFYYQYRQMPGQTPSDEQW